MRHFAAALLSVVLALSACTAAPQQRIQQGPPRAESWHKAVPPGDTSEAVCTAAYNLGATVMFTRQQGVPIAQAMHTFMARFPEPGPQRDFVCDQIVFAYALSRWYTSEDINRSVTDFAHHSEVGCYGRFFG